MHARVVALTGKFCSDSTDNGRFESVESMLLELSRTEKVFELENEIFDLEMQKVHLEKSTSLLTKKKKTLW